MTVIRLPATTDQVAQWNGSAWVCSGDLLARVAALEDLMQHFSRSGNEITISGANLNIKNGSGETAGAVNGLGNLVVGYNELRGVDDDRTGSHNIVVGLQHNFSSYGGLVAGNFNEISGAYASVSGGQSNIASGYIASVSGGSNNTASGPVSSVSGGSNNTASGTYSSVSGGGTNIASGMSSSVSGGTLHSVSGIYNWQAGTLFQAQ